MSTHRRVAVTGMSVNTPLGDTLDGYLSALLEGRSALTRWRTLDASRTYSKIGGDLGDYDVEAGERALSPALPEAVARRLRWLRRRVPWSPRLGLLLAAGAVQDAGLSEADLAETCVVVAGHNLASRHLESGFERFSAAPDTLDVGYELYSLDTTQAGVVSELLGSHQPAYTVGGACASGNIALRAGFREIVLRGARRALVLGAVPEPTSSGLHGFAMIGALSIASFNDAPAAASRPWDLRREGFVPAMGGAAMLLEDLEVATARGARVHAELRGVGVASDASHLTLPDEEGQARAIAAALRRSGVAPEEIDYVSAHATSTPRGDLVELRAIRRALGGRADHLKVNATKSMIGHTFSVAALVEGVAGILQMNAGVLHGTRNIDALDPEVDLDVCAGGNTSRPVQGFLNNAFGFGGINTVSVFSRVQA